MKKISIFAGALAFGLVFSPMVLARNEAAGTGNTVTSPTGVAVQNQNQVKTQNAGETQQLMVQTAEQEQASVGTKSASPRSEMALLKMSEVAEGVEDILTTKALRGGIGDQVRVLAQEQKEDQDEIGNQLEKIDGRKSWVKSLIGPDYGALNSLKKLMEQNQLRIQELAELKTQLINSGDISMVQSMIEALTEQNTSLQEMADAEGGVRSMFGWLFRLFAR